MRVSVSHYLKLIWEPLTLNAFSRNSIQILHDISFCSFNILSLEEKFIPWLTKTMFQNDLFSHKNTIIEATLFYDASGLYYYYLQHVEFYLEIIPERISNRWILINVSSTSIRSQTLNNNTYVRFYVCINSRY